jgi:phage antirepressor YoqD-like protein
MVEVVLDHDLDCLLSQVAADLDLTRPELARVLLESSLVMSRTG